MGTYYKGGASHYHSISENVSSLKRKYPYKDGYFGKKGDSSTNAKVRHIESNDPQTTARASYDKAAYGGIEEPIYNKRTGDKIGMKTTLADGSVITWRNVSSSDRSPAVDINISRSQDSGGVKEQKIHFVKR